jgi:predicted nucleic acid-binding protein
VNVFLDTSACYAGLDRDDANHGAARVVWDRLLTGSDRVLTTNYVIVEALALIQNRLGLRVVRELMSDLFPLLEVEWISPEDHSLACSALLAAGRRSLSLVDCVSFQVMRRLGLRDVFTFDRHFAEQGFKVMS